MECASCSQVFRKCKRCRRLRAVPLLTSSQRQAVAPRRTHPIRVRAVRRATVPAERHSRRRRTVIANGMASCVAVDYSQAGFVVGFVIAIARCTCVLARMVNATRRASCSVHAHFAVQPLVFHHHDSLIVDERENWLDVFFVAVADRPNQLPSSFG